MIIKGKMASKNSFEISGDYIIIKQTDWNKDAIASIRDDYSSELQSVTWTKKGEYLHNQKLGYLHRYIVKKWYGDEVLQSMTDADYVVDHMDNDGFNCSIENLSFLSNAENKSKGLTFDQINKDKLHIALSIFKDFSTGLYQSTIKFNYPPSLICSSINEPAFIELAFLLYGDDYETMLLDCRQILNEYYKSYTFSPERLRFDDYQIEGAYGKTVSVDEYDRKMFTPSNHGKVYFKKINYKQGWLPTDKVHYFHLFNKQ